MSIATIIRGVLRAPSSKSEAQRVIALATLAHSPSEIRNLTLCDDTRASLHIAENLGCSISTINSLTTITPRMHPVVHTLDCNESGTALRLFASIAATFSEPITLLAQGTLKTRPMGMVIDTLNTLGAKCDSDTNFAPLTIRGPLQGGTIHIDGSETSQFLSGLLIALPTIPQNSKVIVKNLKSTPYVHLTLECIKKFGGIVESSEDLTVFEIFGGQSYHGISTTIEGDWSAASFLLVAGATAGEITVTGLSVDSKQGDRAIIDVLRQSGAVVRISGHSITVAKGDLRSFEYDATHTPDLFPPLAALAASCRGISKITGVHRLIHKESHRAKALREEFQKLGIPIEISGDSLLITGAQPRGSVVHTHGDHRIAMALAVAAITASHAVEIVGSECVTKSYPTFFTDLSSARSVS